ncbi:carbohydrate ABC transporter membrane protein 1 (CUT1 family) [Hasllibacter halocynthiae]|uniref:Carbohydrate ABC transporter membrane protein 1 (CUT1 family) n=1 Tax=Hasllibacter halocynthiae TaxID=595589 RepID=A0A2T0X4B0_9RHOB|nr:sugar ABC transporter permease [Hasllibacter halocynthiae]PRY93704.1 carbohydrate ABC transporter membrane protein 1 (CUT1 family) [Hasllibacter halocynthiae]
MPNSTFLKFIGPSLLAMILFIALPIVSVVVQSLHVEHEQILVEVENCVPLAGCTTVTQVDNAATQALRDEQPLGRFVGLSTYLDRNHLAADAVSLAWRASDGIGDFLGRVMNLPFYKALAFTLAYTAVVTPLCLLLGLVIALGVNALPKVLKGPTIFVTLLPMIVTPLIGALVLYWMLDSRGILGTALVNLTGDPDLSLRASGTLTWLTLFAYGIWHSAPMAFIVFYAGLQSVPEETMEAAVLDGASRFERVRYVVVPHLMPLVVFVTLIQLMDNFRVLEPVVAFNSQAVATSLSFAVYNDLRGGDVPLFGSAAATSLLTIIGIGILVTPVAIRSWRDFKRRHGH